MKKAEKQARINGSAVAIGHDRALTIETLRNIIPVMKEKGIRFVHLSELIKQQKDLNTAGRS